MPTEPSYQIGPDWLDTESITGLLTGTYITIQNQGRAGDVLECYLGETAPTGDTAGVSIAQFQTSRVTSEEKVWLRYIRYDIQAGALAQARRCKTKILTGNAIQESAAINNDLIGGTSALTTQGFSELNSKNGSQYEATMIFNNITTIAPVFFGFKTGDSPVILKQRDVYGGFIDARYDVFTGASYTGGTVVNAFNNNDLVVNPTGVSIVANPTVSLTGTQFSPVTRPIRSGGCG